MKIAVLGGAGLLGSFITNSLMEMGHDVAVVDNFSGSYRLKSPKNWNIINSDVTDYTSMGYLFRTFKPEVLVVCTSFFYSFKETPYKISDNVKLTINQANILSSLLTSDVKEVYYFSSHEVYSLSNRKIKESKSTDNPSSERGIGELFAESILSSSCKKNGIRFVCFRMFNLYGPRYRYTPITGTINFLISELQSGQQLLIQSPKSKKDFIHVTDAVDIFNKVMVSSFEGTMNVGTGEGASLIDVYRILKDKIDIPYKPLFEKNSKQSMVADTSLIKEITGKDSFIMMADCIDNLIEFNAIEKEFNAPGNYSNKIKYQRGK